MSTHDRDVRSWSAAFGSRTLDLIRASAPGVRCEVKSIEQQRIALGHGFQPAYFDFLTQTIYLSVFADGTPAPFHVLEGLPRELIIDRARSGRAIATKATLLTGYERNGFFFTQTAAARAVAEWAGMGSSAEAVTRRAASSARQSAA